MAIQATASDPAVGPAGVDPLTSAACLFRGFSDPSRLSILRHLMLGEHRVIDLMERLGLAQSTVSKHLACLRDCGLVESTPQGRATLWSLSCPEELMVLLGAADRILSLTDESVALCTTFGATTIGTGMSA